MKKVAIYRTDYKEGKKKVDAIVMFDGEKITYSEETPKVRIWEWEHQGILGKSGKRYTPKDGEKFIDALPWQYNNPPYFFAEEVEEKKEEVNKEISW